MSELTQYTGGELSLGRSPDTVLAEASLVAKAVDRLVRNRPDLVQVIGGRKHPRFELLQIVGSMFRVTARVRETRQLVQPDGWEAIAEAYHVPSSTVVAVAEGMCTTDEPDWALRPKYEWRGGKREKIGEVPVTSHQRRSMAQTRACSKALRLALGWVLGLAGYEATAAEEMIEAEDAQPAPTPQVRRRSQRGGGGIDQASSAPAITPEQAKALWAVARERGMTENDVAELLRRHGCQRTTELRAEQYASAMRDIEAWRKADEGQGLLPELDTLPD